MPDPRNLLGILALCALLAIPTLLASSAFAGVAERQWCVIEDEAMQLYSDLPRRRNRELFQALIEFDSAVGKLIPRRATGIKPKVRILVFRKFRDFARIFGTRKIIGISQPSLSEHTLAIAKNPRTRRVEDTAFHEYVHFLYSTVVEPRVPVWFEEGLAQYLSTAELVGDGKVLIGKLPARELYKAMARSDPAWTQILGHRFALNWERHDFLQSYRSSWAIVHYLLHGTDSDGEPLVNRVPQLLQEIAEGRPSLETMTSVSGYSTEQLHNAIQRHLRLGRGTDRLIEYQAPIRETEPQSRCLESHEINLLLGQVLRYRNPSQAQKFLVKARETKPNDVPTLVALSVASNADEKAAYAYASEAIRLDPENAQANTRMAEVAAGGCILNPADECREKLEPAIQYYRAALRYDPLELDASFGLGTLYLMVGRAGDALNHLLITHRRAPWAARVDLLLGQAYRALGDNAKAREHIERTLRWERSETWRAYAASIRAQLELEKGDASTDRDE